MLELAVPESAWARVLAATVNAEPLHATRDWLNGLQREILANPRTLNDTAEAGASDDADEDLFQVDSVLRFLSQQPDLGTAAVASCARQVSRFLR